MPRAITVNFRIVFIAFLQRLSWVNPLLPKRASLAMSAASRGRVSPQLQACYS
jgi:hypothetical protein